MTRHSRDDGTARKLITVGGIILGVIAGSAGLIANTEALQKWWCAHFGWFCTFDVTSELVTVSSGGGDADACNTKQVPACISPSSEQRALISGTKFKVIDRSAGVFINGKPINDNPIGTSNIGWLPPSETAEKACITVYARTSACETPVFIKGQVEGQEIRK
jgi:hypothetical protein